MVGGMYRQKEVHKALMEDVWSLANRFVDRIEAVRPMQLPRFPGPPPGFHSLAPQAATATAASEDSRPQVSSKSILQHSVGSRPGFSSVGSIAGEAGRADMSTSQEASSCQQRLDSGALHTDDASVSESKIPRLDLAGMLSTSTQAAIPAQQSSSPSGAARARMSQYDDTEKLKVDITRQQRQLESGQVKIEGQLSSVNFMVEEWDDAAGPLQTSEPEQNAVQVLFLLALALCMCQSMLAAVIARRLVEKEQHFWARVMVVGKTQQ